MFILAGFNQLVYVDAIQMRYTTTLEAINQEGNQTLTGSTDTLTQETQSTEFSINMQTGIIALIIGLVIIGVLAGIRVLGSGLSEYSVKLIYKSSTYYGLWGIFSVLSYNCFQELPFFGIFLWLGLTIVYSMGFFQTLNE